MADHVERRRERARIAQRRSRAQRKANFEDLRARNKTLRKALEHVTEICLGFSDVVISSIKTQNYECLHRSAEPFMRQILDVASHVLEDNDTEDDAGHKSDTVATDQPPLETKVPGLANVELSKTPEAGSPKIHTTGTATLHAKELGFMVNIPNGWPPFDSNLTYGLLPTISAIADEDHLAPLDITPYLGFDSSNMSFASVLFWNTMTLAYSAASRPQSPLRPELFHFAIRHESVDVISSRLYRRLSFRPDQKSLYLIHEIEAQDNWSATQDVSSGLVDPAREGGIIYEADVLEELSQQIAENMSLENLSVTDYLSAFEVQDRLSTKWGLSLDVASKCPTVKSLHLSLWPSNLVYPLATRSRCLGNSIGFPVEAVDDLGRQLRNTHLLA